jgi:hypothetical protein
MSDRPTPETDAEAWIETDRANAVVFAKFARKLERERDEARELQRNALREREAAREALMKIEDLFIDGTDIYADREMMGQIARDALEGAK